MKCIRLVIVLSTLFSLTVNSQVVDNNPNRFVFDEAEYNNVNYKLISLLYGASEIGAKSCKPAGKVIPGSMDNWFSAIKIYTEGEKTRDLILNNRIQILKNRMNELANSKSKEMQVDAIKTQIDLVNVSIDSIAGSNYFNDGSSADVARTGRMPLRENLIIAAFKSIEKNGEENLKNLTTYNQKLIEKGFVNSLKVANEACERKKKVKKCTVVESSSGRSSEECVESEENDPVKGCDVAVSKIPQIQNVLAKLYADLYLLPRISSKELNTKLEKLEIAMEEAIASIPKSDDSKYDWSTGMESGTRDMKEARKEAGIICPGSGKEGFAQAAIDKLTGETDLVQKSNLIPDGLGRLPEANPLDGKKISESAVKFLVTMGIGTEEKADEAVNPKPLKEGEKPKEKDALQLAAEGFVEAWNLSDQLIGQAGQRDKYFEEIALTADELLTMDYLKLSELIKDKAKLEKYLNDTLLQLNQMNGGKSSVATSSGSSSKQKAEKKMNSASGLDVSEVNNGAINLSSNLGNGAVASQNANNENMNIPGAVKIPTLNNYVSGASSVNISGLALNGLSAKAIASLGKTNNAISKQDTQVAGLTAKLGVPANKTTSSAGQTNLAKALNAPMEKINSGIKGTKANLLFSRSNNAIDKKNSDSKLANSNTNGFKPSQGNGSSSTSRTYEIDLGNNSNRASASSKVASETKFPVFPSGKKGLNSKKGKSSSGDILSNESGEEGHESRLISSVIDARNLKNKEAFSPTEDDSLFERVTKAYIRNYEKVDDIPVSASTGSEE